MLKPRNLLPAETVRKIFKYNPHTGELFYRAWSNGRRASKLAGCKGGNGVSIHFNGKKYGAHNLIWAYMTGEMPENEIDHSDRNNHNNAWTNLREATRGQNQANTGLYKNNKLKVRGVHIHHGSYRAMISENGKNRHLGYFGSKEEAARAWQAAAAAVHGKFVSSALRQNIPGA